jgi:outer membrane lipoprotein-sorting protein
MSIFTSRPALRWALPVAVFVAMIGGGASARTLTASAATSSPSTPSAAQLLTDLQNARNQPVSGTVVERADLGLPAVPSSNGSSNLQSLINGSHTLRTWYAGPTQSRVALIGTLGETDIIRNGPHLWVWDSQKNTATHKMLGGRQQGGAVQSPGMTQMPGITQTPGMTQTPGPSGTESMSGAADIKTPKPSRTASPSRVATIETPSPGESASMSEMPSLSQTPSPSGMPSTSATPMTPQDISNAIIAKLDPTTNVTTSGPVKVAGRTANELVLTPRDTRSLVARVTLAVDSQQHVPLRAQIFARNYANPALEAAFTQVNFAAPNPAQFNFTPPPGATVREAKAHHGQGMERPKVVGKGWTSVVIAKVPPQAMTSPQASASPGRGLQVQNLPPVRGPWGNGHLLTSRLFTVLFIDDGRVLAGAVPPQMLYQAAQGQAK